LQALFKFNKNAISLNWHKKLIPAALYIALHAMTPNLFRAFAGDVNKFPSSLSLLRLFLCALPFFALRGPSITPKSAEARELEFLMMMHDAANLITRIND
jgi:hypothetical protein